MKEKLILWMVPFIVMFAFSGCVTDKAYQVSKGAYGIGKEVVIENKDLISDENLDTLNTIDSNAKRYDATRELIRNNNKKK